MNQIASTLTLIISLTTFSNTTFAEFYIGTGMGQSTVTGDFSRTVESPLFETGINIENNNWMFHFSGETASDNRYKGLKLFGGYGNPFIKIGTGFIGVQSSIPTTPGIIGGFYQKSTEEDTGISSTTIPLIVRITPYKSKAISFNLDGFYGLYSIGSTTIPIRTIIPNETATISTNSSSTDNTYGLNATLQYSIHKKIKLRLNFKTEYGQLLAGESSIESDILGITQPVSIPGMKFNNRSISISLIYPAQ